MKTKLLIIALVLPLMFCCEKPDVYDDGGKDNTEHGENTENNGSDKDDDNGNSGGDDSGKDDPDVELPPLEEVEDVCTKMIDSDFKTYCYKNFDVNRDGKLSMSEAQAASVISCSSARDFTGIGYFTNLTRFESSSVKSVNLGYNKKLVSIDCSNSPLEAIDLRYNILVSKVCFNNCKNLTKILLADEAPLEYVDEYIFSGCSSLSIVSLPDNCKTIGEDTFCEFKNLSEIKFPKNLEIIGNYAFYGCRSLTSVTFPAGLTSIGYYAFSKCSGLTSIAFSESLTQICGDAFSFCTGLTTLTFPEGLISIGYSAFYGCRGLTSVTFQAGLTSIGDNAFYKCTSLTTLTFSEGLTSIGDEAFEWCEALTSVSFPDGLTSIGRSAFSYCYSLTSVTFPETLLSIGGSAFYCCVGLNTLTFSEGLTSIGNYAFYGCTALTSVTIPETLASIGQCAFTSCPCKFYGKYASSDNLVVIIDDVLVCASGALSGAYVVPDCSSIGDYAFWLTNLTSVTFPDGLTLIGDYAFSECCKLASVFLPAGLTSIGDYAFQSCTALTSVTFPETLTSIGVCAFVACPCKFYGKYASSDNLVVIKDDVLVCASGVLSGAYVVPDCSSIGDYAFQLTDLISVTLPAGLTSIGNMAFDSCDNLTTITFPETLTSIGLVAFGNCVRLENVKIFAVNPPNFAGFAEISPFYGSISLLQVPAGRVDAYKSSDWGKYFKTIVEI